MEDKPSIRIKRRDGRNVFVFHRDGSDMFELEEMPPKFVDPREWGFVPEDDGELEPPIAGGESWSRTSITGLRRRIRSKSDG